MGLRFVRNPSIAVRKDVSVAFDNREEFEQNVHKCFGRIFDLLTAIDTTITQEAEKESNAGEAGAMNEMRDKLEEVILQCHLAWQYHRLSRIGRASTWDSLESAGAAGAKKD
jgi:hypothetical protein